MTAGTPRRSGNTARPRSWGPVEPIAVWMLHQVLVLAWALALIAVFFDDGVPDPSPIWFVGAGSLMVWFVYFAGPVLVTRARGDGPVADLWARIEWRDVPIGIAAGVALQLLVLPVVYWPILRLTDIDPGASAEELVDRIDGPIDLIILALVVAVGAPLAEEFFYRGFVLQGFRRWLPDAGAVLVSSALFAVVHIQPILYPGTFVLGVVAAIATLRTRRLGLAWSMHVGFNAATLILLVT